MATRSIRIRKAGDANLRRSASALRRDLQAMSALDALGIERATIGSLGLGLREPYVRTDGRRVDRVLSYPLAAAGGRRRFGCVNLVGVTTEPENAVAWSPGAAVTVRWTAGSSILLVCRSPVEVWQLGQAAERRGIAATAVASSQPTAPPEWEETRFWASWDRVILAGSLPLAIRRLVLDRARRPVEQAFGVECPGDAGRSAVERHGEWLEELVSGAVFCDAAAPLAADDTMAAGDFAAEPVPLHGGLSRGRMLYPFLVERRRLEEGGEGGAARVLASYETLVLRADGAVLEAETLPAPAGTPAARRVHSLTDGTRVASPPQASRHATWSLGSIKAFIAARAAGEDPCARSPAAVLGDVHAFLASRVALPRSADLWVATAFVAMTHLHRVFDALPVLLAEGGRGTGKSELATAVAALGFNASIMGRGSAAALVRLARDGCGLVVLDDVEELSADTSGCSDLAQALKLGYKKSTARKLVTHGSGRVDVFDFYGPRLLTSTRGVHDVLGSRCVVVPTAAMAYALGEEPSRTPDELRDELHSMAMVRAGDVEVRYRALAASVGDRDAEIWAPLLAVAEVLGPEPMARAVHARAHDRNTDVPVRGSVAA